MKTSYRNELVYKTSVFANVTSVLITCFVLYYLWVTIYADLDSYSNVSINYMVTYAVIGVLIGSYQGENTGLYLNQLVRSGEITNFFTKPINIYLLLLSRSIGQSVAKFITTTLLTALICIVFMGIQSPATFVHTVGFIISLIFAYLISFNVLYLIGLFSFFVVEIWGFEFGRIAIISILSGTIIPWWFFPSEIQFLIKYSLFNCMVGVPTSIYIGKISNNELWLALGIQLIWIALLFITSVGVYGKAARKVSVYGG
ncbi:ABC transporter permease [Paenibacillus yanchengensis]